MVANRSPSLTGSRLTMAPFSSVWPCTRPPRTPPPARTGAERLYALDLLASILGDGRPSRLYRTVKDKMGLVLEISASDYTPMYPGHFDIWATVEPDKIEDAKSAILKIVEDAKTKKPTEEELARAKRKVYTNHVFAQMTSDGEAGNIGSDWFTAGDLDFSEHYSEKCSRSPPTTSCASPKNS